MAGVKGFNLDKYYKKDYGPHFLYPSKSTSTTEKIINEITTTTVESTSKIKEIITDIFTNTNNTQDISNTTNIGNETVMSNATSTMDNGTSIINNLFTTSTETVLNATESANNTVGAIKTTTENAIDYITNTIMDIATPDAKDNGNLTSTNGQHDLYTNNHNTSYIIMGVLIGILIIIGIGLVAVYMSYKKRNTAHMNGQYNSQPSKEIPTCSMKNLEHRQSKC